MNYHRSRLLGTYTYAYGIIFRERIFKIYLSSACTYKWLSAIIVWKVSHGHRVYKTKYFDRNGENLIVYKNKVMHVW